MRWTLPPRPARRIAPLSDAEELFGRDIRHRGGLELGNSEDYRTVDREEAVRQAIRHQIMTNPGEYAARPDYGAGARRVVKKGASRARLDELRARILDQLAQNRRVSDVGEVRVERQDDGTVRVHVRVRALGREVSTSFPITVEVGA